MSTQRPFHPILFRFWLCTTVSGYAHAWVGAILDHVHMERFALICEVVSGLSCGASVLLGIAYLAARSDNE